MNIHHNSPESPDTDSADHGRSSPVVVRFGRHHREPERGSLYRTASSLGRLVVPPTSRGRHYRGADPKRATKSRGAPRLALTATALGVGSVLGISLATGAPVSTPEQHRAVARLGVERPVVGSEMTPPSGLVRPDVNKSGADKQGAAAPESSRPPEAAQSAPSPQAAPQDQSSGQSTDQLGSWINQALKILKAQGYPEEKMSREAIRTMIQNESGGDPHAINTWDSNAANGTPSKGLMQTIDPTFRAFALPGHGNIYDPVDNIIASVRYSISTYGSMSSVPGVTSTNSGGSYQGY